MPNTLIDFEYFGGSLPTKKEQEIAKPYQREIDFAFFVANFGYSKADYDAITPKEKAFIYKAWENKTISDSYLLYNAVFTAVYNANRPKRKKPLKLWKKRGQRIVDMETINENLKIVKQIDQQEGDSWVRKVYQANNIPFKKGGR
ncbi:hypothetical protein [Massilioclostridium coli]|uniref:hypothetical protein n=1 Tax=Massilioclostridium coli TaxID=1870991 RepID=UPI001F23D911|nr:hypothetical protein [Massilioclostridium coli]